MKQHVFQAGYAFSNQHPDNELPNKPSAEQQVLSKQHEIFLESISCCILSVVKLNMKDRACYKHIEEKWQCCSEMH